MSRAIRRPLTLVAEADRSIWAAVIVYRTCDPFAVEIVLPPRDDSGTTSVLFGRALLIDGAEAPSGDGAVRISPHDADDWIMIVLPLQGEEILFYARREQVEGFLDGTYEVVPLGRELDHVDLDALVERLLAPVRRSWWAAAARLLTRRASS